MRIKREETIDLRVFALMQTTSRRLLTERRITKRPPPSQNENNDNENNENKAPKREKLESEVIERMDSYQQTAERKENGSSGVYVGGGGVPLIGLEAESLFLPPIGYEDVNLFERRLEPLKDVTAAHTSDHNDDIRSSNNNSNYRNHNNSDNSNNDNNNNDNNNNSNIMDMIIDDDVIDFEIKSSPSTCDDLVIRESSSCDDLLLGGFPSMVAPSDLRSSFWEELNQLDNVLKQIDRTVSTSDNDRMC